MIHQRFVDSLADPLADSLRSSIRNVRRQLERPDLSPQLRTRREHVLASSEFLLSGERIEIHTEDGRLARFEPQADDLTTRKNVLGIEAVKQQNFAFVLICAAALVISITVGRFSPLDRQRGSELARLVEWWVGRAFSLAVDGTLRFHSGGLWGTVYVVSTRPDEEALREAGRDEIRGLVWLLAILAACSGVAHLTTSSAALCGWSMHAVYLAFVPLFAVPVAACFVTVRRSFQRSGVVTRGLEKVPATPFDWPGTAWAARRLSPRVLAVNVAAGWVGAIVASFWMAARASDLDLLEILELCGGCVLCLIDCLWCRNAIQAKRKTEALAEQT